VETLGAGNLSVRVKVEGKDEIARVAESFNRAAARIEALVNSHKMLLANASHELRTPLTRLRMGIELLKGNAEPQRRAELEQDIAELDELIEEILLSSRLDSMARPVHTEDVDLLASPPKKPRVSTTSQSPAKLSLSRAIPACCAG
ncbi:MAG: histidine kinase dimerization/phospho-acceptor domain-containing protein, partial [Alphaproteobacteria bacterium]|nr:histidine kinase dimerization/phospho-acceptor domain-containing protein [Alphaproteobacteria bacterium]